MSTHLESRVISNLSFSKCPGRSSFNDLEKRRHPTSHLLLPFVKVSRSSPLKGFRCSLHVFSVSSPCLSFYPLFRSPSFITFPVQHFFQSSLYFVNHFSFSFLFPPFSPFLLGTPTLARNETDLQELVLVLDPRTLSSNR